MAGRNLKERSPTASKLKPDTAASRAMKKKLYRKRTMEEVKRGIHQFENSYDDGSPENQDPAHKTVDLAVDTARTAGDVVEGRVSSYSRKLKAGKDEGEMTDAGRKGSREKRSEETPYVGAGDNTAKPSEKLKPEKREVPGASESAHASASTTSNSTSKQLQKQKIKREYAKAAREAEAGAREGGKAAGKAGKKGAEKTSDLVGQALEKVAEFVAEHPLGCLIGLLLAILVIVIICTFSSCGMAFGGIGGGAMGGTYTAADADIIGVEADYKAKEAALQSKVNNVRSSYPGYDEYNISADTIGHDPYQLASYLSVVYVDYKRSSVGSALNSIFDYQYTYTVETVRETRYRTEERTGYYAVPVYDAETETTYYEFFEYTYYEQVPYDYYILNVTLTNDGIDGYVRNNLNDEDYARYQYMNETHGSWSGSF